VGGERGLSDESAMEEGTKEEDRTESRLLMCWFPTDTDLALSCFRHERHVDDEDSISCLHRCL
jgi:hypothetical protein